VSWLKIVAYDDPQQIYTAAAATLAIYDWIIVFNIGTSPHNVRLHETHNSLEYQTIYQSRWTLPKALFYYVCTAWSRRLPHTKRLPDPANYTTWNYICGLS
jgi:hypothetical protein